MHTQFDIESELILVLHLLRVWEACLSYLGLPNIQNYHVNAIGTIGEHFVMNWHTFL